MPSHVVLTTVTDQPGMLSALTQVLARYDAHVVHVDIIQHAERDAEIYFEFSCDERISVDTIPLVGEQELAAAVRAVVLLPRVRLLVLAGALMGGEITKAVEDVRAKGLLVISLNMAGSVPDAADLVVSDPVQAGVMAVMAVADTATFDIVRQQKRRY